MADIARLKEGHTGTPYAFCATCRAYNHSTPSQWVLRHNDRRHPRRWRRLPALERVQLYL